MAEQLQTYFENLENRAEERTAELVIAKEKAEVANQAKSVFIANIESSIAIATAIIALTPSVLEEEKAIILSVGCHDFFRKPFAEHTIVESLSKDLGLKYIYADMTLSGNIHNLENLLTSENLTVMTKEWIVRLYDRSLEANVNLIMELIQ
jgi:CheY-like chemotaxis protein